MNTRVINNKQQILSVGNNLIEIYNQEYKDNLVNRYFERELENVTKLYIGFEFPKIDTKKDFYTYYIFNSVKKKKAGIRAKILLAIKHRIRQVSLRNIYPIRGKHHEENIYYTFCVPKNIKK